MNPPPNPRAPSSRLRRAVLALLLLWAAIPAAAAPVRVSFLDTRAAREETLRAFARAGCTPENIAALRKAILHYYRTPLDLDTAAFPPARGGFYEFSTIGDFLTALGTNQLSYLAHDFELNCYDTALLLAGPDMDVTADLQTRGAPWLAIQVTTNFNEWLEPVASLGDVAAIAQPPWYTDFLKDTAQYEFPEKHRILDAALYQYQTLPRDTSAETIAADTQAALRRHWQRCGVRFPEKVSLVLLHRARTDYHLVVTDHAAVLLAQENGWLYLEKTGGKGPFLRLDIQDRADIAAYFSTMTWPDYPFNCLSVNADLFLDVPLRPRPPPPAEAAPAE